ncbi:unnamed protein product [Mesocestoides corti]|uniref:Copper transport protein n=1 Tax=Mesocestoides corti TaxID=53468 RepID=A0A0R3UJS8_MESCO|nr:unnamed protein product [Mesocestoides corti]
MSICNTTDVYTAASVIGQELQLLIDEHGPEDFESLMVRIINVLEELEFCVCQSAEDEREIEELQELHDALKKDRNESELQDFALDLDLMQQSWYNETQKLMDRIALLETEKQRLKYQLENAEEEAETHRPQQPRVSDLVSGKMSHQRPPSLPLRSVEVDKIIAQTEERLLLAQQESSAADLQLICLLKTGLLNQAREIKETKKEILFVEAYLDAAEEEVCRLARESGQNMAKKFSTPMNQLNSEQMELETQLCICERELEELSLLMECMQQVESPMSPPMPLHIAPGQGLESAETTRDRVDQDSLLALEQLRNLLYKRNNLRCRLIELKASLDAISKKAKEWGGYCSLQHLLQTLLHVLQLFISYMLMLIIMTYNVYVCVALLVGAGLGYFLFFRNQFIIVGNKECCH